MCDGGKRAGLAAMDGWMDMAHREDRAATYVIHAPACVVVVVHCDDSILKCESLSRSLAGWLAGFFVRVLSYLQSARRRCGKVDVSSRQAYRWGLVDSCCGGQFRLFVVFYQ